MICHLNIITVRGRRYMFYNGNRHGQKGFGYAVADDSRDSYHAHRAV
jgi:hypothetical protein